jgi:hypothetical protein
MAWMIQTLRACDVWTPEFAPRDQNDGIRHRDGQANAIAASATGAASNPRL